MKEGWDTKGVRKSKTSTVRGLPEVCQESWAGLDAVSEVWEEHTLILGAKGNKTKTRYYLLAPQKIYDICDALIQATHVVSGCRIHKRLIRVLILPDNSCSMGQTTRALDTIVLLLPQKLISTVGRCSFNIDGDYIPWSVIRLIETYWHEVHHLRGDIGNPNPNNEELEDVYTGMCYFLQRKRGRT